MGAMVVDIYASPGKQNGQQRRQKWLPSTRRVTEGERGWCCGGCITSGYWSINGPRHQARPTRSTGGSKPGRPWPLAHVTPRPPTVSERPKTASKAAVSGLQFTVSCIFVVLVDTVSGAPEMAPIAPLLRRLRPPAAFRIPLSCLGMAPFSFPPIRV